jgi:nicotinate-nucleotide pyrophosphorylase (carboxylating)
MADRNPFHFGPAERRDAVQLIRMARAEDLDSAGDITSTALIPADAVAAGDIVARKPGVIAGLPILEILREEFELGRSFTIFLDDGDAVEPGTIVARVEGRLRSLLAVERIALNFLQRLSGVATLTGRFVGAVVGTRATILDTRKTTPGWRLLEKYAVRCGGGRNHRIGLYDAVLIKDNHLAWLDSRAEMLDQRPIAYAVAAARRHAAAGTVIEIEVDNLEQLDEALKAEPDIILVDNLGSEGIREAVRRRDLVAPSVRLEASGGVSLETVADIARTGVDRISVGALTHSAVALDLGLDLELPVAGGCEQGSGNLAAHP